MRKCVYIYISNSQFVSDSNASQLIQSLLVSRDGEYMMTGGDKGIVEVRFVLILVLEFVFVFVSGFIFVFVFVILQSLVEAREWSDCPNIYFK